MVRYKAAKIDQPSPLHKSRLCLTCSISDVVKSKRLSDRTSAQQDWWNKPIVMGYKIVVKTLEEGNWGKRLNWPALHTFVRQKIQWSAWQDCHVYGVSTNRLYRATVIVVVTVLNWYFSVCGTSNANKQKLSFRRQLLNRIVSYRTDSQLSDRIVSYWTG